jgi:hypothetical protein
MKLTKVFWKEDHADSIDEESDDLRNDHVHVPTREGVSTIKAASRQVYRPSSDLQSDHDEFIEDEGSEGDRDDVEKFVLEKYKRHDHNSTAFDEFRQPFAMARN